MTVSTQPGMESRTPTEAEMGACSDAVAGLAMVRARLTRCTEPEQEAFWMAVGRCFAGAAEPETEAA